MSGLSAQSAKLHTAFTKIGSGLKTGLARSAVIGAGALGLLFLNVRGGIASLAELEKIEKQTDVALRNRGKTTRLTAKDVRDLANEQEDLTTIDDKAIQAAENLVLAYKPIGDRIFPATIRAAEDLSVALGTDLTSASATVAKALADPAKGIARLTRLGVVFTAQEQEQIKTLVKHGDTEKAQLVILGKLNSMYGGSAVAAADSYAGSQARLHDAVEELQKALATALLPAIRKVSDRLAGFLKDPAVVEKIKDLGDTIAGLFSDANLKTGGDALKNGLQFLKDMPWNAIKDGMKVTAEAAQKAFDIFRSLPSGVQAGLIGLLAANKLTGGLVAGGLKDLAGLALSSLKTITAANVTVVGGNVTGGLNPGPGNTAKSLGTNLLGALSGALLLDVAVTELPGAFTSTQDLIAGNTAKAYTAFGPLERTLVGSMLDLAGTLTGVDKEIGGSTAQAIFDGAQRQVDAANAISVTTGRYGQILADNTHPIVGGLDKLRNRADQIAHTTGKTSESTDTLVGIEKNRKTRIINNINVKTNFNVSATTIATAVNRVQRQGGMVPI